MEKFIIRILANKPAIAPKQLTKRYYPVVSADLTANKPAIAAKQLTDRDIQLFSDAVKHIETGLKVGDYSRIETALQYLRLIEKKVK